MDTALGLRMGASSLVQTGAGGTQDAWIWSAADGVKGSPHLAVPPGRAPTDSMVGAVADGIGTPGTGGLAASVWVLAALQLHRTAAVLRHALPDWVKAVDTALRAELTAKRCPPMGCSLAVVWAHGAELSWVNVGVTAVWRMRDGALSSLAAPQTRGALALRDQAPAPAAPDLPGRALLLSPSGVRTPEPVQLDPRQDAGTTDLRAGDRLLLATGAVAQLSVRQLGRPLSSAGDPAAAAALVCQASQKVRPHKDATALVIHVQSVPDAAAASSSPAARGSRA